jgi:hypothetical protein
MPSPKQTAANHTNSQASTGATASQTASRYNPAKHGIVATTQIMFDESAADLAELAAEYHEQHSPADSGQRFLVDTLVSNEWRLRRLRRVEAELWDTATNTFMAANTEVPACTSGDAFATGSATFERHQRIVNSCERAYHRALKELKAKVGQALSPANPDSLPQPPQAEAEPTAEPAPTAPQPPQPEQTKPSSTKLGSFRQKPKTAPPVATPLAGQHAAETPAPAPTETQNSPNSAPDGGPHNV